MRYIINPNLQGVYNYNHCIKSGPDNPNKWQKWCFICKMSKEFWTIFAPYFKGNFKTYCICNECAQNTADFLIEKCMSYESKNDELLFDFL